MTEARRDARLLPLASTVGGVIPLAGRTGCVIGSGADADVQVTDPGIRAQHCVLEHHDERWLIVDAEPTLTVNGLTLSGVTYLFDRDIIAISATHRWEFASGEERTKPIPMPRVQNAAPKRRKSEGFAPRARPFSWKLFGIVATAAAFIGVAALAIWYERHSTVDTTSILSDRQAIQFDSLLVVAYDHLERGNSLLELGIQDAAAQEFARGINTLALSELRNHPQVKPRIQALESSVAAMYRERRLAVPDAYAGATSTMSGDKIRTAVLSREQFEHAFDLVSTAFRLRFGSPIVVVGRDHAEHLSLYGKGGALDLRSMTMTGEQVAFVVAQCRSFGIRVKDFSQDSILQLQVKAAIRAGLPDRAGTGLHLHIDRFADRRDRWTIGARLDAPSSTPGRNARRQTSRNLSRVTPERLNSDPSSSKVGVPRSTSASST